MEKLKPTIEFIKKHLFWILCGIAFVATFTTYYIGSRSLRTKQEVAEKKINSSFKKVEGIKSAGDGFHPNSDTHLELIKLTNKARSELEKAWELKEKAQRPLFEWPDEIGPAKDQFRDLRPIEKAVPFEKDADNKKVQERDRGAYQDLVKNALPRLAAQIGEVWLPEMERVGVDEARKTRIRRARRVVFWNEENQQYWEDKFTKFTNSYNDHRTGIPWTIQVLYAQEDMWILQSILEDIILKTNGTAAANDLAKIKVIDHIFIGRDAQGIVGDVLIAGQEADAKGNADSGGGGGAEGTAKMLEMMKGMGQGGGGGPGVENEPAKVEGQVGDGTNDPANGRYVDQNLAPVGGKSLREAFTKVTPETAYLAIAKRVPVRIGLQMDERAVWDLLANCANARLPLEVKQVRFHSHEPGNRGTLASKFSDGAGRPSGDGESKGADARQGMQQMEEMMKKGGGGGAGESGKAGKNQAALSGYDIPVEIYGIIYLYNPVDPNVVKQIPIGDEGADGTPTEPSASVQTPVGRLRS